MRKTVRYRSAKTGLFVTEEYARQNPYTTFRNVMYKQIDKVQIECVKDFDDPFKRQWNRQFKSFMKKGWKTWTTKNNWGGRGSAHPEGNKYAINFPKSNFKEV